MLCFIEFLLKTLILHFYFKNAFKDLSVVTVYTCLKIYLYKKALIIFVNNATFYSMLYHGVVEYVANTWICVYMIVK